MYLTKVLHTEFTRLQPVGCKTRDVTLSEHFDDYLPFRCIGFL